MSSPEHVPDELDLRIRSLEAERMRPSLAAPTPLAAALGPRIDVFLDRIRDDFDHLHRDENEDEEAG